MKELPVVWNNKSGTAIPFSWNNTTRSGSPEKWNKIESSPIKWQNEKCLRENWGAANSARIRPSVWEEKHSLSEKWNTPEVLPDKWGTSEAAVRPHANINFSQKANAANKLISDAAGKAGSTIKNIAGNAVNFVRSEETANKVRSIRDGALSAAGGAGAAFASLKGKAAAFAAERKKSDNSDAPVNDAIEYGNNATEAPYAETASSDYIDEKVESKSFDELYEKAVNSVDEEESNEAITDEANDTPINYVSDEIEDRVAVPQTPAPAANPYPPPVYVQSQNDYNPDGNNNVNQYIPQNYSYEEKKKSPVVFILIGVIAVLLVVAGILGGMLLMKNKDGKISDDSGNNAAVSTTSDSENEIFTSTVVDENNESQTEISTEEIPTEPITENVADQYTSEEVFAMYSAYISENPDPNHTYDDPKYGYYLIDLNKDGTQELVITSDYTEDGSPDIEAVYAITQNRLEAIWLSDVRTYNFICEGNIIQAEYIYPTGLGTVFYKYSSINELVAVESITYDGTYYSVKNNANSVITEEEADAIRNQYKKMKFEAKPLVIQNQTTSNNTSNIESGFTFFDSIDKVKSELSGYSLINEEDDVSISNQNQHLIYYNYPPYGNIDIILGLCFIDNRLVGVNFGFESTTYTASEIFNNIRDNISAKYGQPDSSDTVYLCWYVNPFGSETYFFLYNYGNGVQLSFYPNDENMSSIGLLPIDVSNIFLTLNDNNSNISKYTVYDTSAAGSDFSFNNEPYSRKVRTESTGLNLRAAPLTSAEIIIEMPKDSNVSLWGVNSEWAYVSYTVNGTTYYGYASRQYIGLP